jgi:hypothetical protein
MITRSLAGTSLSFPIRPGRRDGRPCVPPGLIGGRAAPRPISARYSRVPEKSLRAISGVSQRDPNTRSTEASTLVDQHAAVAEPATRRPLAYADEDPLWATRPLTSVLRDDHGPCGDVLCRRRHTALGSPCGKCAALLAVDVGGQLAGCRSSGEHGVGGKSAGIRSIDPTRG